MTNERVIRYKQKRLNERYTILFIMNLAIILLAMFAVLITGVSGNNQNEGNTQTTAYESNEIKYDHIAVTLPANAPSDIVEPETVSVSYCRNLSENDKLMLAKIVMAEAEGESLDTKIFVLLTILNRVESNEFPNTIKEVIFQNSNGVYQFSPMITGGRYWTTEPNEECWEAVNIVNEMEEDISNGALYFESCTSSDNWHSRNLEFLFESDSTRFYK